MPLNKNNLDIPILREVATILTWRYRKKVIKIVRSGRPTDEPKILSTRIRLSEKDVEMLDFCSDKAGKKKSEIIRLGIKKVYEELAKD